MRILFVAAAEPAGASIWATVAIAVGAALGAALISAVAVLAGTIIQGRNRRDEQRRDQMVATASDFASRIAGADALYRDIVHRKAGKRIDEMRWVIDEAARSAAKLRIAFGPESEVTKQTGRVISELTQAWEFWSKRSVKEREDARESISTEMHSFTEKAHLSLWQSSSSVDAGSP